MSIPSRRIRKILFIHFGGIGDVILAFPALQSLRETFPAARITTLVEPRAKGIKAFSPAIDEVLTFAAKARPTVGELLDLVGQLRHGAFDLGIASGRSPVMPALLWLAGIRWRIGYAANCLAWTLSRAIPLQTQQYAGNMYYDLIVPLVKIPPRLPQVALAPEDRAWAVEFLVRRGVVDGDRLVVIHPGASRMAELRGIHKTWSPANWVELIQRLKSAGFQLVLAGGPDDEEVIKTILAGLFWHSAGDKVHLAYGQTNSLGQLAALIQRGQLLIAVDSAPMHLGVAVGTPTVALFGPTDPQKLLPAGTMHQAVHVTGLPCRPCLWDRRNTTCHELTCLNSLAVEQVLQAVWRALPNQVPSSEAPGCERL
ncbi:MAG: glycosyltransferase family 9 protein [Cyanobacteria bacterium NC_groundwater_1444_Ag_S-0.65um_54_12]|nr:glycosyltransferase family 9 protein [Cyanobacteria bacterium NC_groundwater_1444_Ag_S-0.65um_54_12]